MAILSNLIVNGCERVLGTLYCDEAKITTLTSTTISTSGSVNFGTTKANAVINLTSRNAISGIDNWLRLNNDNQFTNGINLKGAVVNVDGEFKVGSGLDITSTAISATLPTTFNSHVTVNDNLSVSSMNAPSGIFDNLYVLDTLKATTYSLDSIQTVNGSLYVSPTLIFSSNTTAVISSISGSTVQIRIVDSSTITKDNAGGHVWTQYSKVKLTGRFGDTTIGTCTGTLTTKMNTTAGALDISFECDNASDLSVKTYSKSEVHDVRVMIYEVGYSSTDSRPVGVFITGYGNSQNSSYIDIYQGEDSRTKPRVRLGNLSGLDNSCTVANIMPSGYGLYCDSAFLKATIYSTAGQIGGWTIGANSLTNGTIGTDDSLMLYSNGLAPSANIAGSGATTNWRITAGSHFGVTKIGGLYANFGKIGGWSIGTNGIYNGTNSLTSTTAGLFLGTAGIRNYKDANTYVNITEGVITAKAVDLTGKITATSGKIGDINITDSAIYSGNKSTYNSTSSGLYLDKNGKLGVGSSSQYIQFDGTDLNMKVKSLTIDGSPSVSLSDLTDFKLIGRNLLPDTNAPTLDYTSTSINRYFSHSSTTKVTCEYIEINDAPIDVSYGARFTCSSGSTSNIEVKCLAWGNASSNNIVVVKMIPNKTYTMSCYAKVISGTQAYLRMMHGMSPYRDKNILIKSTSWARLSWTFTYNPSLVGATDYDGCRIYFGSTSHYTASFELCGFQLEEGGVPTDYTPDLQHDSQSATNYLNYTSANGLIISTDSSATTGYNTQINSSGFHVRDGSTVLASYGSNVTLYHNDTSHTKALEISSSGINMYYKATSDATTSALSASLGTDGLTVSVGKIGGFTIDSSSIYYNAKNSTTDGSVTISSADFTRTIGNNSRSELRLAIGNNFGVSKTGFLYCSGLHMLSSNSEITVSSINFTRTINNISRTNLRINVGSNFGVKNDGTLYASNAIISGDIQSTSGTVGGFTIANNTIYSGTKNGTSDGDFIISSVANTVTRDSASQDIRLSVGSNFYVTKSGLARFRAGMIGNFLTVTANGMYTKPSNEAGDSTLSNSFRVSSIDFSRHMSWQSDNTSIGKLRVAIGTNFAIDNTDSVYINCYKFMYQGTAFDPFDWLSQADGGTISGSVEFQGGAATSGSSDLDPSAIFLGDVIIDGRISNDYAATHTNASALPLGIYTTNDKNTFIRVASSSKRYKDIDRTLTSKDIEQFYKINVYSARYKEGYLAEGDELIGKNMPMFIAEEIDDVLHEAVIHVDGKVENWNERVVVPIMFQMIKSQKEQIDELKKELEYIKNRKE